jgi:uncharacterized membrane protein (UPF0182 family)
MFLISLFIALLIGLLLYFILRKGGISPTVAVVISAATSIILLVIWGFVVNLYGDILFYESIGYEEVFWLRIQYFWTIFGVSALGFLIILLINYFIADWLIPVRVDRVYQLGLLAILFVLALIFGLINANAWDEYLLYINSMPTGVEDALYGRDLAFYLFTLPILQKGVNLILLATFGAFIASALTYGVQYMLYDYMSKHGDSVRAAKGIERIEVVAIRHAGILAGFAIASLALWWWLRAVMVPLNGVSYLEVNYYFYGYYVAAALSVVLGIAAVIAAFIRSIRGLKWVAVAKVVFVGLFLIIGGIIQLAVVSPQELKFEEPYIAMNLEATRDAFMVGPENLETIQFSSIALNEEEINNLPESVVSSIRLLDYEHVALPTFDGSQEVAQYYDFLDTDMILSETLDGEKQVMSSARELPKSEVPKKNFVNEHLVYVCGMGAVTVDVSQFNKNGTLIYLTSELPMEGDPNLIPENPFICYGESEDLDWVVTNTDVAEAGTPTPDGGFEETEYSGTGGIEIGSGLRRFMLASYVGSFKLFTSGQVNEDSRLHIVRNIVARLEKVLPAGWIDYDPYMVAAQGVDNYTWITDVAMHSDLYPLSWSTSTDTGDLLDTSISYIRPSVKATVDAYDGTLKLFIVDDDPMAEAWGRIFPNLFSSEEPLPGIAKHFRYPEEVFILQTDVLEEAHVSNATVYYNGSDVWSIWKERLGYETAERTAPRYVYTQLPGEDEPSYVIEWGYTRRDKEQAKAQLVGRINDGEYELLLYVYQSTTAVGPSQFEGKIDKYNRPWLDLKGQIAIAEQNNTLIRGNLIALPVGQSQLYIKPLYLRDSDTQQEGGLPILWKVAVGTTDDQLQIGIGDSLREALDDFIKVNFEATSEEAVDLVEEPEDRFSEIAPVESYPGPEKLDDTETCAGESCKDVDEVCIRLWRSAQNAVTREDPGEVGRIALELLEAGCD